MTRITLSRRRLAQTLLGAAVGALIPGPANAGNIGVQPMPIANNTQTEGDALAPAVPLNVGYALSETQAKEVALALKDYPGSFGKARAYHLPNDIAPSWASTAPQQEDRKGEGQ